MIVVVGIVLWVALIAIIARPKPEPSHRGHPGAWIEAREQAHTWTDHNPRTKT